MKSLILAICFTLLGNVRIKHFTITNTALVNFIFSLIVQDSLADNRQIQCTTGMPSTTVPMCTPATTTKTTTTTRTTTTTTPQCVTNPPATTMKPTTMRPTGTLMCNVGTNIFTSQITCPTDGIYSCTVSSIHNKTFF